MLAIFLDSETNGLNLKDHQIIEIAFQIQDVYSGVILETFHSLVRPSFECWQRSSPASLKIHGIEWKELEKAPSPQEVAKTIERSFCKHKISRKNALFICQNPSFDRPFFSQLIAPELQESLHWPYHWLDLASMHWALCLKSETGPLPWEVGSSKNKIAHSLHLPEEHFPHRALQGMLHLVLCYEALVGFPGKDADSKSVSSN